MGRKDLAQALEEIGELLELKGENPFKVKAYSQAARAVLRLEEDPAELAARGELIGVKGIGKALSEKITEYAKTGRIAYLEELRSAYPASLFELFRLKGLGAKKIKTLYEDLRVASLGELEYACLENRLAQLKGFGPKSQDNVLASIATLKKYRGRFLWSEAEGPTLQLIQALSRLPGVARVEAAGEFRRLCETVAEAALVAGCDRPERLAESLKALPEVEKIELAGPGEWLLTHGFGLKARLAAVPGKDFVRLWHWLTGGEAHLADLNKHAAGLGWTPADHGWRDPRGRAVDVSDEPALYAALGLPFIPPELREGLGEVEAAAAGELPQLIELGDVQGVFHVHSGYSDGGLTLPEIVAACQKLGYAYVGLSDHSRTAQYAGGMSLEDLDRQRAEVEALRAARPDFEIFWGVESDILPDGSLDYPDEVLARFDFVIASVHSNFTLPEARQTERLVAAVRNPYTTILGHMTGRLLLAREPYRFDAAAVLEAAAESGAVLEINASPHRLDLDWREMRRAKALGLKTMIDPDAHAVEGLADVRYGVQIARKGWLTRADALNALTAAEMRGFLEQRRKKQGNDG
jgi:DNA polymerase (family 10)